MHIYNAASCKLKNKLIAYNNSKYNKDNTKYETGISVYYINLLM